MLLVPANNAHAETPTDEQLLELERQIEQQEAEQAEAKRKAAEEAKRKAEADAKRKVEEEANKAELEKQRAAEEEAHRIAEEENAKLKAETEKKEKYSALISEAEQAVGNKDKELAISKYNEALKLYPDDTIANAGMREAEKLPEKICVDFPGIWEWEGGGTVNIRPDGTLTFEGTFAVDGTWTCADPKARIFTLKTGWGEQTAVLRSDGCLRGKGGGGLEGCYWKKSR